MDVGQVQFQVKADNLQAVLDKAQKLQEVLQSIDGKSVSASAGGTGLHAKQKALKLAADTEYKYALQQHNKQIKLQKQQLRAKQKALRLSAQAEKKYALQQRALAQKTAEEVAKAPQEFQRNVQTTLVNWGAQFQTLGVAMQRFTSPFANVFKGITMGVGYRLMYKALDSINGAFSRYDTMETYGKVLNNLGIDATKKFVVGTGKAQTAIENLEQSVLGLPTGLDEIVAAMKIYAGATGDVERATKLAIAANNAYIAGGMDSRQQLFTQRQLLSLAGGAELSSNQWDSLRRNAPLAIRTVAKEMNMGVKDMIAGLKDGTIAGQEFLDVFIKAGTEGKIKDAAQIMKNTWDAVSQNVQNALNRMGEGILKTLDSVFEAMDGRTFLQHVLGVDKNGTYIGGGIRGVIDDMAQGAKDWIKAHPEKITNFFDNLSKVDWKGIAGGFAEFGLMMGRFYSYIGKIFGSANLVKAMLWTNLAGKGIQMLGGFTKGTAGIVSWIATLAKFGGGAKVGRAVKNGAQLAAGHGAIVGATKTVASAAMSWQSVANTAVMVTAIPAMAWAFKQVSLGLQELAKVDFGKISVGKVAGAAGVITAFAGLAAAMGALTTGNAIGWITTAGTAVGIAEVAAISKTMKWLGEGLNAIANAELPTVDRLRRVMQTMNEVSKHFKSKNIFESIGKTFDAWSKSAEFKAVKNMTDAFRGIGDMVTLKLPKGWRKRASNRFNKVKEFIEDVEDMVVDLDARLFAKSKAAQKGGQQKGTSKAATTANSYTYIKEQLRNFADNMQALSDGIGYLDTALMSVKKFNKDYANLNKLKNGTIQPFDWDAVFYRVSAFADQIYKFIEPDNNGMSPFKKLSQASQQLKGGEYNKINELFSYLPKIIGGLEKTYKKLMKSTLFEDEGLHIQAVGHKSPLSSITDKLEPLFDAINAINTKVPGDISGLKRLKGIQTALGRIPEVINKLVGITNNANVGNINVNTIREIVTKITEALAEFDALNGKKVDLEITIDGDIKDKASDEITKVYKAIKKSIDKFDTLPKTKTITLTINTAILGAQSAIDTAAAAIERVKNAIRNISGSVNKTISVNAGGHVVRHNGGKIRPIYRAHGGNVFHSRGTDIVPAMLSPGEFVVNRMAASRIGDSALWKLNHMDLSGALQSISARLGQGIIPRSSVINNTTNNTRNTHVDIHNGATAGVGLGRANRWVRGL